MSTELQHIGGFFTAKAVIFSSMNGQKTEYDLGTSEKTAKAVTEAAWEPTAFESVVGRKPETEGELQKWIREASQAYYRETGKIKGLREWLTSLQEVEMTDQEMANFVAGSGALDTITNASHRTIRRIVGKHIIDRVEIWKLDRGNWNINDPNRGNLPPDARIRIVYLENGRADSARKIWQDDWCSYSVLKWALRNWRNLYGAPLIVNGQPAGKVDYRNPALAE